MAVITHPPVSPSKAKSDAIKCIVAGVVPFIQSSPGLGKSSIVREIAAEGKLKVIDLRLSQCAPEDLQGLPMRLEENGVTRSAFLPFNTFPLEMDSVPEGYEGWLLFLDEFNSASKSVQAAAYKLILDRLVGNYQLHPKVAIVCAGNLQTDKAIVNSLSTAMQSRLIHIIMQSDTDEWLNWASSNNIDFRVEGFIRFQPTKLHVFQPDHQNLTFPCPRTWEFTSRLISGTQDVKSMEALLAGTISPGMAMEFIHFCEEYTRIPQLSAILSNPEQTTVPQETSTRFAVLTMLMASTTTSNVKQVMKYITRFLPEEQIIFLRSALNRTPKLREIDEVSDALINIMRFVNT